MKKIFRTTMAICLFIMTMLVVNTFKTQAQSVRAVEPVVTMLVNQWRQISLVPEEGYRIIAAEVGSHNQNVSVQITTGEWTCEIFGNESTTTTIVFEVEIEDEYGAGWTVFVYVNVMVLDINTALNVLQPELPDLMFAIRQNELLRFV